MTQCWLYGLCWGTQGKGRCQRLPQTEKKKKSGHCLQLDVITNRKGVFSQHGVDRSSRLGRLLGAGRAGESRTASSGSRRGPRSLYGRAAGTGTPVKSPPTAPAAPSDCEIPTNRTCAERLQPVVTGHERTEAVCPDRASPRRPAAKCTKPD